MRWMASIALACLLPGPVALAQFSPDDAPAAPSFTPPVASAPPISTLYNPDESEGPSEAEIGPVKRHFVLASEPDNLVATQVEDNKTFAAHQPTAIDRRIKVPLVHDVLNDGVAIPGHNPALDQEILYLNWGAVTSRQALARRGHYFTITVANHGPKTDLIACFQYRQVKSREVVRTLTQKMTQVSGGARCYFAVVSHAFQAYGPVSSWRFTLLKGDTVVAEVKSFIW